jgi:hypothetical protein
MKTHILRRSKQDIAERLVRISGEVREANLFEDEPVPAQTDGTVATRPPGPPPAGRNGLGMTPAITALIRSQALLRAPCNLRSATPQ